MDIYKNKQNLKTLESKSTSKYHPYQPTSSINFRYNQNIEGYAERIGYERVRQYFFLKI